MPPQDSSQQPQGPNETGQNPPVVPEQLWRSVIMGETGATRTGDPYNTDAVSQAQWDQMSQMLGYDARQAYIDEANAYVQAGLSHDGVRGISIGRIDVARDVPGGGGGAAAYIDPTSWVYQQMQSVYGQYAPILSMRSQAWAMANGQAMPSDLMRQEQQAIMQAPASVREQMDQALLDLQQKPPDLSKLTRGELTTIYNVLDQRGADTTKPLDYNALVAEFGEANVANAIKSATGAVSKQYSKWYAAHTNAIATIAGKTSTGASSLPFLDSLESDYYAAHPPTSVQDAAIQKQFQSALGRAPSAAEIKQFEGKSSTEVAAYLDSQPLSNGMQYGVYNSVYGQIAPMWEQYFGRAPTDNDVKNMVGKSTADIQRFIQEQPSHTSDGRGGFLSIGQQESYGKYVDTLASQYYGITSHDFLSRILTSEGQKPGGADPHAGTGSASTWALGSGASGGR